MPLPPLTLILGGARSGKSTYGETLIAALGGPAVYIATAIPGDPEMAERIHLHRQRRGPSWLTIEAAEDVAGSIAVVPKGTPVLVDCLTLWLSNLMMAGRDVDAFTTQLLAAVAAHGPVVMVSNEVGCGIVPENALARSFRDHAGRLNQAVAAAAQRVVLVVAGLPLVIKSETGEAVR